MEALNRDYSEFLGLIAGDGHISKYRVSYYSIDQSLTLFVVETLLKLKQIPHVSKNRGCNVVSCHSKSFSEQIKKDISDLNILDTEGFVDGLMSAEGSINNTVNFSQKEPLFHTYMVFIRKVLGKENNITRNQNSVLQAHWSPSKVRQAPIFTHCSRKRALLNNHPSKTYKFSTHDKILSILNSPMRAKDIQNAIKYPDQSSFNKILRNMIQKGELTRERFYEGKRPYFVYKNNR